MDVHDVFRRMEKLLHPHPAGCELAKNLVFTGIAALFAQARPPD